MNYYAVLSTVQQVTEMLPVSSSTQLFLVSMLMGRGGLLPEHIDFFLHGPTIGVLGVYFYSRWKLIFLLFSPRWRTMMWRISWPVISGVTVSLAGMGAGYFILKTYEPVVVFIDTHHYWWMIGGQIVTLCSLLSLRKAPAGLVDTNISVPRGIIIGFVQAVALLPGVSRFALTYAVLRRMTFTPRHAFEASFLFVTPFLGAAFVKGVIKMHLAGEYGFLADGWLWASFVIGSIAAYGALALAHRMVTHRILWWWSGYVALVLGVLGCGAVLMNS